MLFRSNPKNAAAPRDQAACMGVGEVVQLLDGLPNPLRKLLAHRRRAVDGAGDGGDRHLGEGCHGADIGLAGNGCAASFSAHQMMVLGFAGSAKDLSGQGFEMDSWMYVLYAREQL